MGAKTYGKRIYSQSCIDSTIIAALALMVTGSKLYPAAGILGFIVASIIMRNTNRRNMVFQVLGGTLGIITAIPWLLTREPFTTPSIQLMTHGLLLDGEKMIPPLFTGYQSFLFLVVGIAAGLRLTRGVTGMITRSEDRILLNMCIVTFSSLIFSYIYTISFDYRMIFLYPCLALLLKCIERTKSRALGMKFIYIISIIVLYNPIVYTSTTMGQTSHIKELSIYVNDPLKAWTDANNIIAAVLNPICDSMLMPIIMGFFVVLVCKVVLSVRKLEQSNTLQKAFK